jgi:hypothetical protein
VSRPVPAPARRLDAAPARPGIEAAATGERPAGEPGPLARRRPGRHLARPLRGGPPAEPVDPQILLRVLAGLHRLPITSAPEAR